MTDLEKNGWVSIFKSNDSVDVDLKKSKLAAAGIEANLFDHQDSMLTTLNNTKLSVSLYVHKDDESRAVEIIQIN